MTDQDRAVDLARHAFATAQGVDISSIQVGAVDRERIPNPPLGPGQVSVGLVRYRFFVQLRSGNQSQRLRVEAGHVYQA